MAGRPKSPLGRRKVVSFVNVGFDDTRPCQFGHSPGTSTRQPIWGSTTDLGQYAVKSSLADDRINGHGVRK